MPQCLEQKFVDGPKRKSIYKCAGSFWATIGPQSYSTYDLEEYEEYGDCDSYDCRETFIDDHPQPKQFYLECQYPAGVARVLYQLESWLKLKNKYRSRVYRCKPKKHNIIFVKISEFWHSCPLRSSFLTAFLKSAALLPSKSLNFQSVLKYRYFKDTPDGTKLFLHGKTSGTYSVDLYSGWVSAMDSFDPTEYQIEEYEYPLEYPTTKQEKRFFLRGNPKVELNSWQKTILNKI